MKKLMIAAMLLVGTSAAFAGDSEPLKAILKADNYAAAAQLLNANLGQLASPAEKAKAYNHVTTLALKIFDEQNAIEAANIQAQIQKTKPQPFDTLAYYESAYNATVNALECAKYDAMPDAKGKVKPKFTATLSPLVANARLQLVTAGNYYAGKSDEANVLKYWGTFLDTDDNPMFASTKASEKQFIGQVAYYTALYANQAKQYERAEKYADVAMADSAMHQNAENLKYAVMQKALNNRADSLAFADKLKAAVAAEPQNETVFGLLCNIYSGLNMTTELNAAVEDALKSNPNNFTAWAMKGQALANKNSKEENPNWDECIDCFKKAIAIKDDNSVALTYLGFALNAKAMLINNDPEAQKKLYTESAGYLEKSRDVDPDRRQSNWAYPLFQCYYSLYGPDDSRTKEAEALTKN